MFNLNFSLNEELKRKLTIFKIKFLTNYQNVMHRNKNSNGYCLPKKQFEMLALNIFYIQIKILSDLI